MDIEDQNHEFLQQDDKDEARETACSDMSGDSEPMLHTNSQEDTASRQKQNSDAMVDVDQNETAVSSSVSGNRESTVGTYEPGRIYEFPLDDLHPDPEQPRQFFDANAQKQLELSISSTGVKVPIMVRKDSAGRLIIIDGERRWRASKKAKLPTVAGFLVSEKGHDTALIANVVRQDLSPMDQAEAIQKLIDMEGFKRNDVRLMLGKTESTFSEILALNQLPEPIKENSRGNPNVSRRLLLALVRADATPEEKIKLFRRAQQFGWTSEQLRITLAEKKSTSTSAAKKILPFLTQRLASVRPGTLNSTEKDALRQELGQCKRAIEEALTSLG